MEINEQLTNKIALLSRLQLTEEELGSHSKKLADIVTWVEQLQEINTENIEPLYSVIEGNETAIREDKVIEENYQERVLPLSSKHEAGLYLVPKVIE